MWSRSMWSRSRNTAGFSGPKLLGNTRRQNGKRWIYIWNSFRKPSTLFFSLPFFHQHPVKKIQYLWRYEINSWNIWKWTLTWISPAVYSWQSRHFWPIRGVKLCFIVPHHHHGYRDRDGYSFFSPPAGLSDFLLVSGLKVIFLTECQISQNSQH